MSLFGADKSAPYKKLKIELGKESIVG